MSSTVGGPTARHGATSGPPSPTPPAGWSRATKLTAAAIALAVLVGGATALYRLDLFGPENQFQTIAYAGENPFTSPVGTDQPGMVPVAAGGEQPSDTGEMYAANPDVPACDGAALLDQLQADPAKATAWAQVQRLTPDKLPTYLESLTPVLLRADTAVVDHGYAGGTFVPTPAVLAAGTAVFINSYGQPTVKCFSGNPLTPGASTDPAVTLVTPTDTPIATNTFRNPATGGPVSRPGKPDNGGTGPSPGPGPVKAPVTGRYNLDGSISLSDGRLQLPNGQIVSAVPLPKGAERLPDGGYKDKSGKLFNQNGTPRERIQIGTDTFVTPDGKMVDGAGKEIPLPAGNFIVRNHDGTATWLRNDVDGTFSFTTVGKDGNWIMIDRRPGQYDKDANGIRDPLTGKIGNLGEPKERKDNVKLPGGGGIKPNNTPVPRPQANTGVGGAPEGGPAAGSVVIGPDGKVIPGGGPRGPRGGGDACPPSSPTCRPLVGPGAKVPPGGDTNQGGTEGGTEGGAPGGTGDGGAGDGGAGGGGDGAGGGGDGAGGGGEGGGGN